MEREKITPEIIESVNKFLGEEGRKHFMEVYQHNGSVFGMVPGKEEPRIRGLHTHTLGGGMEVRNHLRRSGLCDDWWEFEDFESGWVDVVEAVLGIDPWEPYEDYEKEHYDIKIKAPPIVVNGEKHENFDTVGCCWPNAGQFHETFGEQRCIDESEVTHIRKCAYHPMDRFDKEKEDTD